MLGSTNSKCLRQDHEQFSLSREPCLTISPEDFSKVLLPVLLREPLREMDLSALPTLLEGLLQEVLQQESEAQALVTQKTSHLLL